MTNQPATLTVVMYHYVRDLPRTRFPRIKGLLSDDFARQVDSLKRHYEVATLNSAMAFLQGAYRPARPLCLLTFDDALKEHAGEVTSLLADAGIQGIFFIQTAGPEGVVSPVHKNHFLLAALPFEQYRREFVSRFVAANPSVSTTVDRNQAARTYRWDLPEVAEFKYLLNFVVADVERESILDALFEEHLGDETAFARELYFSWEDARAMQAAGMVMGGHSHGHAPLPTLSASALHSDLTLCAAHLHRRLHSQPLWPFSYPYGRVSDEVVAVLRQLDFCCGFTTQVGRNTAPITDPFLIRRIDPKDVTRPQSVIAVAAS